MTFVMADRPHVYVGYEMTNRSTSVINPLEWHTVLLANGRSSLAWSLAFGNGAYPEAWTRLLPNQTFSTSRGLGEVLFETPGDYHLVLQVADYQRVQQLAGSQSTVDVRVTP